MSTSEQRTRMANAIMSFEARRDPQGHLAVYELPPSDGGGRYEVAGINDRYNKQTVDVLVAMLRQHQYAQAEALATEYIAQNTDRAGSWTRVPALEFYLRDCVFNRGGAGAGKILQRALGIGVDGVVGAATKTAVATAESNPSALLQALRDAREKYEREVVGRDEQSIFWKGLVNRWNKAVDIAKTFPLTVETAPTAEPLQTPPPALQPSIVVTSSPQSTATLSALRMGMTGDRVMAWQSFLRGQGFDVGVIDGSFGEHTRDATKAFQEKFGLGVDGVAGRETLLKAAARGLPLIEEPADDESSSNFPPRPSFQPLVGNAQRAKIFGHYEYMPAPTSTNPEAIKILGNWQKENIVPVSIPQLRKALGKTAPEIMYFHRLAARQLASLWNDWDSAGLLDRVLIYDGSFVPRFIRGSRTTLSNHAFGSAFDINAKFNSLGQRPALVKQKGSVRELVPLANKWGFYWGGHFETRPDGMHFEVAFLK